MTAIAIQHREEILQQLASGMLLKQIAAKYQVTKQALSKALRNDPDYKQALADQADALVEYSVEEAWELPRGAAQVDIARVRELRETAFKYAACVNPSKYSPKAEITHHLPDGPLIVVNLPSPANAAVHLVEDEPPALEPPA